MHEQLHDALLPYVRRLGRISGPLFVSARTGERVGDWRKVLDRVAARVGYAAGAVRTRQFRVAYATHRCTCDNVDANTVRTELGHSSLVMMQLVYTRAQRRSRRMGPRMEYRLTAAERAEYERRIAEHAAPRVRPIHEQRTALVAEFLARIEGMGMKRASAVSGVDRTAIQRLRAGTNPAALKARTITAMEAFLRQGEEAA